MVIKNSVISAIRALKRNKTRTVLTSLGVIIGILSVVSLYGIGSSARVAIHKKVFNYGTNAIQIQTNTSDWFSERDITNIKGLIPYVKYITPIAYSPAALLKNKRNNIITRIWGVDNPYFYINGWVLEDGSLFTPTNILSANRVVVIGQRIKKDLYNNENPIGSSLLINSKPYTIVGTLKGRGSSISGRDFDNQIMIPYTTFGIRILNSNKFKIIWVATEKANQIDDSVLLLRNYFKEVHNLDDPNFFEIRTSQDQLRNAEGILKIVTILLIVTAAISLIVGGIGIMNIMLVSVSERTREIGIRMAIGAKGKDILMQFLIESIILSSIGGIIGIVIGIAINYIVVKLNGWDFIFSVNSLVISFTFTTTVGIIFGFYPAYKASQLNPIEALRHE